MCAQSAAPFPHSLLCTLKHTEHQLSHAHDRARDRFNTLLGKYKRVLNLAGTSPELFTYVDNAMSSLLARVEDKIRKARPQIAGMSVQTLVHVHMCILCIRRVHVTVRAHEYVYVRCVWAMNECSTSGR